MKILPSLLLVSNLIISSQTHPITEYITSPVYGLGGLATISLCKHYGKGTADKLASNETVNAALAQDFKFLYNAGIKWFLQSRVPGIGTETLNGQMFESGNKALSFFEFIAPLGKIMDEMAKLDNKSVLAAKSLGIETSLTTSEIRTFIASYFMLVMDYFFQTAQVSIKDPATALVAAAYLASSWLTVQMTRAISRSIKNHIANRDNPMVPLFLHHPFDVLLTTTIGIFLTTEMQTQTITPLLKWVSEKAGHDTTKTEQLAALCIRAGQKGPFAWDATKALAEGLKIYFSPALTVLFGAIVGSSPLLERLIQVPVNAHPHHD